MDRHFVVGFPEARTCSSSTLRRLREIDAAAELLYLGPSPLGGRWALGTMDPTSVRRQAAARNLDVLYHRAPAARDLAWHRRMWMERAKYQGFRPRYVFECVDPDGAIVEQVRRAHYDHQNTSDNDFFREMDAAEEARQEAARKELTDPARARDVWRTNRVLQHAPYGKMRAAMKPDRSSTHRLIKTIH